MTESRTQKSIKNASASILFYFLNLILGFFSRKAFFDYLGSEVLGLNTTASNILGLLNLTELGIGTAVGYFLYKPLFNKDTSTINEIVSLQGWLYRKVAYIILALSGVTMLFFPLIFAKSPLSLWYAYTTFGVLLIGAMLSYFFNYKQIVLSADQKNYKVQSIWQGFSIIKTILQILFITYSSYPFVSWLTIELVMSILTTAYLQILLKREYPWLQSNINNGKELLKKYPDVWTKTKQAFFHKIGYVALSQSSPLIIYGFTSLTTVALYGNYILIVSKIGNLVRSVFDSTSASIGNLVASGDEKKTQEVFWELFDSRLMIATICLLCLFFLTQPFISLWLGSKYLLSDNFLLLYILYNSISMTRTTVDSFLGAYGLFKDIWAPFAEAILNIGFSIWLGYYWSLNGIIIGITISQIIIISIWKPYFLFKEGFKKHAINYFGPLIKRYILIGVISIGFYYYFSMFHLEQISTITNFIIEVVHVSCLSCIICFLAFYLGTKGTRAFTHRMIQLVRHK